MLCRCTSLLYDPFIVLLNKNHQKENYYDKESENHRQELPRKHKVSYRSIGFTFSTERKLKDEREAHEKHLAAHRLLINSPTLTVALAPALISKAAVLLQDLEQRKVIPSTLPNVIEDRLERLECICGASLAVGTDARRHLEELLDRARDIDDAKDLLRHLNDAVKRNVREAGQDDSWAARLRSSQATIQRSINVQTQLEEEVADLRAQIRGMESTNLEELERLVSQEEREVKRLIGEISRTEQHIRQLEKELKEVDRERSTVERANARVRTGVMKHRHSTTSSALSTVGSPG